MMCCEWCTCTANCDECKRKQCEAQDIRRRHYRKESRADSEYPAENAENIQQEEG